jgi:hypothetical protein
MALADHHGPAYLRFGRPVVPNFMPADEPFVIGKAIMLTECTDVTIIATGHLVWEALVAAEALEAKGISAEVINIHTIKPLDEEAILKSVAKTGRLLIVDEAFARYGIGAEIAAQLSDIGSQAMLNPAQLNRKLMSLVGVSFTQFNNPYAGQALNYGNFDGGLNRFTRANEYTMVKTMIADRMMSELSCNITMTDFNKMAASRLLFAGVSMTDTPATAAGEAAIVQNIKYLHNWLLKEDLAATDGEVQRTYSLFKAVWADRANASTRPTNCSYNNTNDPNYTARSWAAVVGYMIGDSKFLFE